MSAANITSDGRFFVGGGASGDLINAIDWSKNPLGPVPSWPMSLRALVAAILHSRHPMFLWWGPELIQLYNDAYVPSIDVSKHPAAMGQRGRDCWGEIWPIISPQIDDALNHGKASWNEDHLVPIFRNGRIEEVYWTYGYSPVFDDEGCIGGVLVVCTETTPRVIAERRLQCIRRLADATAACDAVDSVVEATLSVIRASTADIPFALLYRPRPASGEPVLVTPVHLEDAALAAVDASVRDRLSETPSETFVCAKLPVSEPSSTPGEPVPEAEVQLLVITPKTASLGTFAFGLSPRLPFDSKYRNFIADFIEQVELSAARIEAFRARAAVETERRNMLLQAPIPTALLIGPRHVYELANAAFVRMVGGRDLIGKTHPDAFPEMTEDQVVTIFDRVYQSGEAYVAEEYPARLDRRGDGSLENGIFRFTVEPLRDGADTVYGIIVVVADVTEQVEARRTLERTNAERQELLSQLESASEAKDQFMATVSHELRTPLTAMLGWARILRTGENDPARIQKGLAVIERNARVQAQLIDDIFDVSRIVTGKVRLSMNRVDAAALLKSAVETTRPVADAREVHLRTAFDPDLGDFVADEDRMQQVIGNLLSNAVKFTPKGGDVTLEANRRGSELTIRVCDTGKGITPAFLPHVFDAFRQDDASPSKQQSGLGLGLAIARHLVELHGGTIAARSEGEGHGATFEVRLPIRAVEPSEAPPGTPFESAAAREQDPERALSGVGVLVVDDEEDARDLVATVLERAGAVVKQADCVTAAMRQLSTAEIQVIVSDLGMPGEDGYALLRRVRASGTPRARELPALALTAYARTDDRDRALLAGFQAYAAKPIDPARLVRVVAGLVRRRAA